MRILLYLLLAPLFVFAQGEQRYADGTATDQDGNTFEWINYGTQDWAIENAEVVTYRDGSEIPQVTDDGIWASLTTGAWCYYNNDSSKGKLYNWYAVMGIHDTDPNTPNKEFAPEGWHVPTDAEWTTLENYLMATGYATVGNSIAKSMASTTGWADSASNQTGGPGFDQTLNNTSGFNAFPLGSRVGDHINNSGYFRDDVGEWAVFSTSSDASATYGNRFAFVRYLSRDDGRVLRTGTHFGDGLSVRFVRDAVDTEAPLITLLGANPVTIDQGEVYTEQGATATDNVDGDLTNSIIIDASALDTSVPGTYTVTYSVADSAGNTSTATRTVNVIENPTVYAGPDQTICENETVTLGAATASNYSSLQWESSGTGTFSDFSSLNPTYTPSAADIANGAVILTLTANGTNGEQTASDSVVINIEQAHLMVVSSGNEFQTICEGETIAPIDFTVSNGATSAILVGAPDGIVITPEGGNVFRVSGSVNENITLTKTYNFSVTTQGNGCTAATIPVSIEVNPDQELNLTSSNEVQEMCEGVEIDPITYALAGGATGVTITGLPNGVTHSVNAGLVTISGTPSDDISATSIYYYTLTSTGSCASTTLVGEITIEPNHEIQLTSNNGNQTVDKGTPISPINFSTGGGATEPTISGLPTGIYVVLSQGGVMITIAGTPTDDITTQTAYVYTVTTTGNGCTPSTYSGTIIVNPVQTNPTETGILLNGTVSAENNQIKNVADPSAEQDAINKRYLDQRLTINGELVDKQYLDQIIAQLQSLIDGLQEEINILKTDTQAPVITLLGNNPVAVNQGATYTDAGATASDNVDGNLTNQIVTVNNVNTAVAGTYTVTYSVTDSAGNSSTVTRTVNVSDTEAPVITLIGDNPLYINQGDTYTDPGATAIDNVDGDLTSSINTDNTVNTAIAGTYPVTYFVGDASGNVAVLIRTVNVESNAD